MDVWDEYGFINIDYLTTQRQRDIRELLSKLTPEFRDRLVNLMIEEAAESARAVFAPHLLGRVKIVIKTSDENEFEVGPFNQGVVIDTARDYDLMTPMTLRDVATGKAVARCHNDLWFIEGLDHNRVTQLFIQAA